MTLRYCPCTRDSQVPLLGARSPADVLYCLGERPEVDRISRGLFGRRLRAREYAALAGAPQDAETIVGVLDGGLYLEMRDRCGIGCLTITLVRQVRCCLVVVNDGFRIQRHSLRGQGIGWRVFARQLRQAKRMGASRIDTTAGRGPGENGYYTWPRFGFDAPLPGRIRTSLPPGFARPCSLLDLMQSRAGRTWWLLHGTTIDVSFDLSEHSRCWRAFRRYRAKKRSRSQALCSSDLFPAGGMRASS